jgi:hypothetical protein
MDLYDKTKYNVYLVAENDGLIVDLMKDEDVINLTGITGKAVYSIPRDYIYEDIVKWLGLISLIVMLIVI